MLGVQRGDWEAKMLPNKLVELVRNKGNMEQEGTGFFLESEAEMLTILNFLNFGDDTNITEAMKDQVMKAIAQMEAKKLEKREEADLY